MTTVQEIAESKWTTLVARAASVAGPIMLGIIVWLAPQYLDGRFNDVKQQAAAAASTADNAATIASTAAGAAQQAKASIDTIQAVQAANTRQSDEFQTHMTRQVDKLTTLVSQDSATLAGVAATVSVLRDRPNNVAAIPFRSPALPPD